MRIFWRQKSVPRIYLVMTKGFTHESTYNESKEWYTPRKIFDALGIEFDLDPCSPGQDIVPWIPARRHLTVLDDGLNAHWEGKIFMNPPYGMDTLKWMKHLHTVHKVGIACGIALVFARPDTRWFHDYIPFADAICFIKGRVHFVAADKAEQYAANNFKPKVGCGAASMLVAFGKDMAKALFRCGLGLTLPVGRNTEKFRTGKRFVGDKIGAQHSTACPNENPPRLSESRQGVLFGGK